MKQLTSLLWKEWFEIRLFVAIGLFVFLGLPLIGGMEAGWGRRFEIQASLWVFMLGGLLASVIGVGVVVRDLNGRLEEFWRSRPVSSERWLFVKYVVGLAAVIAVLSIPLIVQILINRPTSYDVEDAPTILKWHPLLWAAFYSLSFAIASLLRRGAHAAMLSIAVMLLIYFLPTVLPPIHFLSLSQIMDKYSKTSHLGFVVVMIVLSATGLAISLAAARNDWRIESDRKLIYWSIGGALLILFSSAAFQIATNLPLIAQVDLPANDYVDLIQSDGVNGVLWSHSFEITMINQERWSITHQFVRKLHVGATSVELGPATEVKSFSWWRSAWQPEHPDIIYAAEAIGVADSESSFPQLKTINLGNGAATLDEQSFPELAATHWPFDMRIFVAKDRLYLLGPKVMTFDLADRSKPRLLSIEPFAWTPPPGQSSRLVTQPNDSDYEIMTQILPPVPGISPRQRLESSNVWAPQPDGDILTLSYRDYVTTYRLDQLTDTSATFRKIGRYDPSQVEKMFGRLSGRNAALGGLYFEAGFNDAGGSSSVTVFDVTGPRPRPVGHFAFADTFLHELCPLPDGRLLAAGKGRLYLLGPPPRK